MVKELFIAWPRLHWIAGSANRPRPRPAAAGKRTRGVGHDGRGLDWTWTTAGCAEVVQTCETCGKNLLRDDSIIYNHFSAELISPLLQLFILPHEEKKVLQGKNCSRREKKCSTGGAAAYNFFSSLEWCSFLGLFSFLY